MVRFARMGIEEAEMYARFAQEIAVDLYEEPSESKIAAVDALLYLSRQILKRIINAQFTNPDGPCQSPMSSEVGSTSTPYKNIIVLPIRR
jgi:hypothetical protein